jgi:5-oxoprolinase (ATP-hydrolysing) subunit C
MSLLVIDPGLSTTVQDTGRPGYREWGVPPGGAFDRGSAALANALLGNSQACAVLEFTLIGGTFEASSSLALALAGAPMMAAVIARTGQIRPLKPPLSFTLRTGERLAVGHALEGVRAYLAVHGGWQTPLVLGSRSREDRMQIGEILPAEWSATPTRRPVEPTWHSPVIEPFRIIPARDSLGHPDLLSEKFWSSRRYQVDSQSNRMGIRLQGEPLDLNAVPDPLSMPVAPGALQVAGGQLIVLGIACGTMGGYPRIAHVISADLDRLGQLRPGDSIQFRVVTLDEARRSLAKESHARRALLARVSIPAQDR